jgi:hypothetical protein
MIYPEKTHREREYGPQEAKTFHHTLCEFILREFPRLGGAWVIEHFVAKMMSLMDEYYLLRDRLQPGQTVWIGVDVDEKPAYRKSMSQTRQTPVILTLTNQEDIAELKKGASHQQILRKALARVTREAYQQGAVLSLTDLGLLFARSSQAIAKQIQDYEHETGQQLPRRGTVHDLGRTLSHKRTICYKAFVEGKTTPTIARETYHTPKAVDRYLLDFARVYLAVHKRKLSPEETAFTIGRPVSLVKQYVTLIQEFGLSEDQVADRVPDELLTNREQENQPQ